MTELNLFRPIRSELLFLLETSCRVLWFEAAFMGGTVLYDPNFMYINLHI